MFGESDIKLKANLFQGIRMKFFIVFICSIVLATVCIVLFQSVIANTYGDVAKLEEEYSFLYFMIFLMLTSIFFYLFSKNMITRLEQINQSVNEISMGNLEVHIQTVKKMKLEAWQLILME